METRASSFRALILPITFGLATVALAVVIWLTFGGSVPFAPQSYQATIVLSDGSNVYPGSDVDISGVKVGQVANVERDGRAAAVLVQLQPRYAPLRRGATAVKRLKSLLGEGYIAIAPGPRSAAPIPDGGELAPSRVTQAQNLDAVLSTFSPSTRAALRRVMGGLAGAFAGRAESLSNDLGESAPFSESLDKIVTKLQSQRHDLQQLVPDSAGVLNALAERQAVLQAAITSGDRVLGALATDRRSLVATIRALPPFLVELRGAASRLGATSSLLDDVSSELAPASELVAPALRAVRAAAPQFSGLFHQLPGVFAAGRSGLPAAQAIIRAAGSSFETVYPVSRQVIPLLQLFGALRTNVASFFANLGQFLNGTIATDEGISHGVGGALSVWNETLAGWKVRLPSNRPNPYPRPGSAEEIGNGGLLSYDCTQLHNQLYIPPTGGNGAIPCRLQGPWTFNGKSAYYPRLTLAPP